MSGCVSGKKGPLLLSVFVLICRKYRAAWGCFPKSGSVDHAPLLEYLLFKLIFFFSQDSRYPWLKDSKLGWNWQIHLVIRFLKIIILVLGKVRGNTDWLLGRFVLSVPCKGQGVCDWRGKKKSKLTFFFFFFVVGAQSNDCFKSHLNVFHTFVA